MKLKEKQKFGEDISFVKRLAEKRKNIQYSSIAIAYLWAVIIGIGYSLSDFTEEIAIWYWNIMPLTAFLISIWIGIRTNTFFGIEDRSTVFKHIMHWGSMFALIIGVLLFLGIEESTRKERLQAITIVCGIMCYLAGIHMDRRYIWLGVVLAIGAIVSNYLGPYPWTVVGIIFAIILFLSAHKMKQKHDENETV